MKGRGRRQTDTPVATSWTLAPVPVAPWDPPGLPPRTLSERCARHKHCAFRDDDPTRCSKCHSNRCGVVVEATVVGFPTYSTRFGDRIRVVRDETRYPSRGTWPQFRGRTGTVVEINRDRHRPHLTEFGVVFGAVHPRSDGRGAFTWSGNEPITWFKGYELVSWTGSERHADSRKTIAKGNGAKGDYGLAQ